MTLDDVLAPIETRLGAVAAEREHLPKISDFATLKADIARIDGKLSNLPSMRQLLTMIVSTWAAGAAIVFAIFRFAGK